MIVTFKKVLIFGEQFRLLISDSSTETKTIRNTRPVTRFMHLHWNLRKLPTWTATAVSRTRLPTMVARPRLLIILWRTEARARSAAGTERRSKTKLTGKGGARTTRRRNGRVMRDVPKKTKSPYAPPSSSRRTWSCASSSPISKTKPPNCVVWSTTVKLSLHRVCSRLQLRYSPLARWHLDEIRVRLYLLFVNEKKPFALINYPRACDLCLKTMDLKPFTIAHIKKIILFTSATRFQWSVWDLNRVLDCVCDFCVSVYLLPCPGETMYAYSKRNGSAQSLLFWQFSNLRISPEL